MAKENLPQLPGRDFSRRDFFRFGILTALGVAAAACSRLPSQPKELPVSKPPGDGNGIEKEPVPLAATPFPTENPVPEIKTIADWEKQGEIPKTPEEWQKTVALFDKEIIVFFGPANEQLTKGRKPAEICQFWPLLSEEEREIWLSEGCLSCGDGGELLTFSRLPSDIDFTFNPPSEGKIELEGASLVSVLKSLLIKIPQKDEFSGETEFSSFLSPLSEKSLFELGLMLNLTMLRTSFGTEFFSKSYDPENYIFREVCGFRSLILSVERIKDKLNTQVLSTYYTLDIFARLYSLWPHFEKSNPSLWGELYHSCLPYFFEQMQNLNISPKEVWEYYKQGQIFEFMKVVGSKMQENGVTIEGEAKQDQVLMGFLALSCSDGTIVDAEACNALQQMIGGGYPEPLTNGKPM